MRTKRSRRSFLTATVAAGAVGAAALQAQGSNRVSGFDHAAVPMQRADAMVAFYRKLGFPMTENENAVSVYVGSQMINFHRPTRWQDPLGGGNSARMTLRLQQLFELLDRQAGILDDAAHSECVDGIVAGNRDDPLTIRHHDVLSLAGDTKACLLQCANGIAMIDAWNSRHVNRRLRPPAPRLPS